MGAALKLPVALPRAGCCCGSSNPTTEPVSVLVAPMHRPVTVAGVDCGWLKVIVVPATQSV